MDTSTINAVLFHYLYGMTLYIHTTVYRQNTTLRESMYMRASGASELRKVSHFHILKLQFLSVFCWYFRYFVGTNDMLVGLNVPTNFQMYRQNSEKALLRGGGGAIAPLPPPPPSGYANVSKTLIACRDIYKSERCEISLWDLCAM